MARVRLIYFALALCLSSAAWAQDPSGSLARARSAILQGDFVTAAADLTRAIETLDPKREGEALADAHLQRGFVYLTGLSRTEEALADFQRSAELARVPANAHVWASLAAEKLGRQDEAERYKALALAPPKAPSPSVQAAAPAPAPQAKPQPQEAPKAADPDAVQRFFGKRGEEKKAAPAEVAPPQKEEPKVDAFQYFFGRREQEMKEGEDASSESPEAERPPLDI